RKSIAWTFRAGVESCSSTRGPLWLSLIFTHLSTRFSIRGDYGHMGFFCRALSGLLPSISQSTFWLIGPSLASHTPCTSILVHSRTTLRQPSFRQASRRLGFARCEPSSILTFYSIH